MSKERDNGILVCHKACDINAACESSDALAVYQHQGGSYSAYCFSCGKSAKDYSLDGKEVVMSVRDKSPAQLLREKETFEFVRDNLEALPVKDRRIKASTYDFYGVKMDTEADGETIRAVYYPTYRNGIHVGYRMRSRIQSWEKTGIKHPEKVGTLKSFKGGLLDTKKGIEMFGQHLFPSGGKMIIITMGEEDCIAAYLMSSMQTKYSSGYPTISVPSGENLTFVKENYEYLQSFEKIIIIPDNDEPGQAFKLELCKLLPVGKTYILNVPKLYKDPSEMWSSNASTEADRQAISKKFYNMIWNCDKFSPAGIKSLSEGWDSYLNRGKDTLIPFPDSFGDLNERTFGGYAVGEITTIAAPSSVGKSSFIKAMIYTALHKTTYNIGVVSLEETIDEFLQGLLSLHMKEQLQEIPEDMRDRDKEYKAFKKLLKIGIPEGSTEERITLLDHQGSLNQDELMEKIDYMIRALNCKIIIIDPATLAVSSRDSDEDEFTSDLVKLSKRGDKVAIVNVMHVRKNSQGSTANSEGGDISEESIKGSGSWFQVSSNNILLMRNKVHPNPIVRNTTTIKLSKCRRHGKSTGMAGFSYYNGETGVLEKGQDPSIFEDSELEFESKDSKPLNSFGSSEKIKKSDDWD